MVPCWVFAFKGWCFLFCWTVTFFFFFFNQFEGNLSTSLWLINEWKDFFCSFSAATTSCVYYSLYTKLPCQACQRDFITAKVWCYCFSFPYADCCSFSRHFLVLVINDNTVPPFRESEIAFCSLYFVPATLLMVFAEWNVLKATIPPCETWWNDVFFWYLPDSNAYSSNSINDVNSTRRL